MFTPEVRILTAPIILPKTQACRLTWCGHKKDTTYTPNKRQATSIASAITLCRGRWGWEWVILHQNRHHRPPISIKEKEMHLIKVNDELIINVEKIEYAEIATYPHAEHQLSIYFSDEESVLQILDDDAVNVWKYLKILCVAKKREAI